MTIYCCQCEQDIDARLTSGAEIYPHRPDLKVLPFWRCDTCGNYVGCHHKTTNRTQPLGNIPTPAIRAMRVSIHAILDPLWKSGRMKRGAVYAEITKAIGHQYHSAELRTIEEARQVLQVAQAIAGDAP